RWCSHGAAPGSERPIRRGKDTLLSVEGSVVERVVRPSPHLVAPDGWAFRTSVGVHRAHTRRRSGHGECAQPPSTGSGPRRTGNDWTVIRRDTWAREQQPVRAKPRLRGVFHEVGFYAAVLLAVPLIETA